jgi:hypothetical protein
MTPPTAQPRDDDGFHITLTDTGNNVHLDTFAIDHTEVAGHAETSWSVRKTTLRGGKQEGVDVIEVDNGRMTFSVVPTRGMNVHKVHCGDVTLGWNSPVREIVNPAFINPADRGGLGWLEGFNEWMARCGYEFAGHPGEDGGQFLTLHGKASNIPASKVEVFIEPGDPNRIHIRGRVEETMFKFADLELVTDISTEIGSTAIRFDDVLTNRGQTDQEYQVIYHSNHGEPLLEEGSRFVGAMETITPFDQAAADEIESYDCFAGPTPGYGETLYCMAPFTRADGSTTVMLHNAKADRGLSLSYDVDALPIFNLWKNTDVGEKGYVTGLEPATGFPHNRSVERESGRLRTLGPGSARRFLLEAEILLDAPGVDSTRDAISDIQGSRETRLVPAPESRG